ncbi:MAG: recombinase TnpX [Firmicutes bacterium]|nr:recombinase TnpX [Bacillota bacterium]
MENIKTYNAVIYCRLSREDGDKSESDSIGNQKALIMDFIKDKRDIKVVSVKSEMSLS